MDCNTLILAKTQIAMMIVSCENQGYTNDQLKEIREGLLIGIDVRDDINITEDPEFICLKIDDKLLKSDMISRIANYVDIGDRIFVFGDSMFTYCEMLCIQKYIAERTVTINELSQNIDSTSTVEDIIYASYLRSKDSNKKN